MLYFRLNAIPMIDVSYGFDHDKITLKNPSFKPFKLDNVFFLTYGDSYLKINYKKILDKFKYYKKNCLMTLVYKNKVAEHKPNVNINKNSIKSYGYSNKSNYLDFGALLFKKKVFRNYRIKKLDLSHVINDQIKKNHIDTH